MTEPAWRAPLRDARLRPTDLAGTRDAMDLVDELWAPTLARARQLPEEQLHVRVDGEYSFVETQRD